MRNFQLRSVFVLFLMLFTFLAVSCKEEREDPQPAETATITFTSPTAQTAVTGTQVVTIAGKINAENQIHGYKIIVRNKTSNTETVVKDGHDHATTVDFSGDWTNNVTGPCEMEAEVVVTLDHHGKIFSKTISFHCMP